MTSPYLTRQRDRWTRPNAHLLVRPDQPRVAVGSREGGQWTADGTGAGSRSPRSQSATRPPPINDPRVLSDGVPDNDWMPGAQYAQGPRARGPIIINGSRVEPTPGQAARLAIVEAQSRDGIRRVHELDPSWRPTPSAFSSVEGLIAAHRADAQQAQSRALELQRVGIGPGSFAAESIPARGPERDFKAAERLEIDRIGSQSGRHTCGTKNPGPFRESFIPDHQPPSALVRLGQTQRLFPHCLACSLKQGGHVRWMVGD